MEKDYCFNYDSNDVNVFAVASLEPNEPNDPNVIAEFDDDDRDPNTRSFVISIVDPNHDPNVITVIATPNPDVNEPNLPASWTLTGGTGTGKLLHTVDRTIAAKTVLTCSCGTSSKTTTIYVVKVDINMSGLADANELNPGKYINANWDTTTAMVGIRMRLRSVQLTRATWTIQISMWPVATLTSDRSQCLSAQALF